MHFSIIYSNSKNIDPNFESSFASKLSLKSRLWACNARFFSNETIFSDFFQSLANFPAKDLLALENCHFSLLFVMLFCFHQLVFYIFKLFTPWTS
jgi:hypothetical protein